MKIVLVTPLLDLGGGQRYVSELANYWSTQGHSVSIICLRSGEPFYSINSEVRIIKLCMCQGNTFKKAVGIVKTFIKLRKKIKEIHPNFVLSILSSTNIFTLISTRFLNVRVFVRDAMSPYRERSKKEMYLRKLLYKKADGVILLTKIAKDFVEAETGVTNARVIHNPVSHVHKFDNIKKEKMVITVGRLTSIKAQHYFLETCAKINRSDWKFVILGEGELREELNNQIVSLELNNKVIMPGAVQDVDSWLNKSMIFASTSVSEAWGNAISEAMAVGLPVVSFNCDVGPSEMIEDGENGFLVPVGDVDQFSKKIVQLMNDENLRNKFSLNASEIQDKFSIDKISKEILEFCS
ncbi:glycosyltransferase family 4 protein [Aureibaculum sp. A20]|uniref:Glycosyltransferase family 4 protein n=1 Tax=Aureibaculum flavum TaxID=2795986 RepID=A0ABS0WKX4_9FLAO|nr:glycosyltransferase family 4 protein [Aureibaculum flavum]MBJ2172627.1 glycosyltransferase family 4 protein [Aureibaculum flavum]